ncbi:MAG: hypothetical protein OXI29_00120 [bacterium]|nr:hypothetical protein [bacterium]
MDEHIEADHRAYDETYRKTLEEGFTGMVALIYGGELQSVYDHLSSAYHTGRENFGEGKFTLIRIGEQPAELGAVGIGLT